MIINKLCKLCNKVKPLDQFNNRATKTGKTIKRVACSKCECARAKTWYENNKERVAEAAKRRNPSKITLRQALNDAWFELMQDKAANKYTIEAIRLLRRVI